MHIFKLSIVIYEVVPEELRILKRSFSEKLKNRCTSEVFFLKFESKNALRLFFTITGMVCLKT